MLGFRFELCSALRVLNPRVSLRGPRGSFADVFKLRSVPCGHGGGSGLQLGLKSRCLYKKGPF